MKKTRAQRRIDAIKRCIGYKYDNSKAKRKGVSEDAWEQELQNHMDHLDALGTR